MTRLPSMPLFPADFFADTEHLSRPAAHAYLFLLCHAWLRGARLPNDDVVLARLAGFHMNRWRKIKPEVMAFWRVDENGMLWNLRQRTNFEAVNAAREVNKATGALGGRPKSLYSFNGEKGNGYFKKTETKPFQNHNQKEDSLNELRQKRGDRKFVETETEQWNAWAEFYRRSKGEALPQPMRHWESRKLGWYFETEWPPAPGAVP